MSDDKETSDVEPDIDIVESGPIAEVLTEHAVDVETGEDLEIEEVYITDDEDDTIISKDDAVQMILNKTIECWDDQRHHEEKKKSGELVTKNVAGTTQSDEEIGHGSATHGIASVKTVQPPYPPELLSDFMEVDETHFRCVRTKVSDAVGREFLLDSLVRVRPSDKPIGHKSQEARRLQITERDEDGIDQSEVDDEAKAIMDFIAGSNDIMGFESVIDRACMDYEAIGWGALEVIRSVDGKIAKIAHIPATRVRVLRGWKGFVERLANDKFVFYQNFGEKIVHVSDVGSVSNKPRPYDPNIDGELQLSDNKLKWQMIDRKTGEPTEEFSQAANELIWITKNANAC